jgi:precorrin-8X/cobalt-precorrin-8 methylmutase
VSSRFEYVTDGAEIYRQSFATIRAEAALDELPADVAQVAVRMIHACGMTDLVADLAWSPGVVKSARDALRKGAPILCDAAMVAAGVTRRRLPADNQVVCTLGDPRRDSEPPGVRPRSISGRIGSRGRWLLSATLRPRCSGCSS